MLESRGLHWAVSQRQAWEAERVQEEGWSLPAERQLCPNLAGGSDLVLAAPCVCFVLFCFLLLALFL